MQTGGNIGGKADEAATASAMGRCGVSFETSRLVKKAGFIHLIPHEPGSSEAAWLSGAQAYRLRNDTRPWDGCSRKQVVERRLAEQAPVCRNQQIDTRPSEGSWYDRRPS